MSDALLASSRSGKKASPDWQRAFEDWTAEIERNATVVGFQREYLLARPIVSIFRKIERDVEYSLATPRLMIHRGHAKPIVSRETVAVWIRSGWTCEEEDAKTFFNADTPGAAIVIFIPVAAEPDLTRAIAQSEAAQRVLDAIGHQGDRPNAARREWFEQRQFLIAKQRQLVDTVVQGACGFMGDREARPVTAELYFDLLAHRQ